MNGNRPGAMAKLSGPGFPSRPPRPDGVPERHRPDRAGESKATTCDTDIQARPGLVPQTECLHKALGRRHLLLGRRPSECLGDPFPDGCRVLPADMMQLLEADRDYERGEHQ